MTWCFWRKKSTDDMAVTTARSQNILDSQISIEEGTFIVGEGLKGLAGPQQT